ncbi:hypothetical protein SSX86_032684, partial [Deinandra increscens subsp. villosa]
MKSKQKLQIHDSNKYLKPGALASVCNTKASASALMSCLDLGKKRVAVLDAEKGGCSLLCQDKSGNESPIILSPERLRCGYESGPVDLVKESNLQKTEGIRTRDGLSYVYPLLYLFLLMFIP